MANKVLRTAAIQARAGICNTVHHEQEQDELWPQLFSNTGGRAKCCFEHELDEVLDARAAGATDEQVRAIVRRQVALRESRFAAIKAD